MAKPLSQITFDFGSFEAEKEPAVEIIAREPETVITEELPQEEEITREEEATPIPVASASTKTKKNISTRGRRALKDFALTSDLIEIPEDDILFQKQYYAIGEVAAMFKENQSLIRYWETEFDILKPKKNGKGDRFFRPVDVKNLVLIYDLLRRRKFTIDGAKDYLKKNKKAEEKFAMIQSLEKMKTFFLELKASL